jgi:hypothetical protein
MGHILNRNELLQHIVGWLTQNEHGLVQDMPQGSCVMSLPLECFLLCAASAVLPMCMVCCIAMSQQMCLTYPRMGNTWASTDRNDCCRC